MSWNRHPALDKGKRKSNVVMYLINFNIFNDNNKNGRGTTMFYFPVTFPIMRPKITKENRNKIYMFLTITIQVL